MARGRVVRPAAASSPRPAPVAPKFDLGTLSGEFERRRALTATFRSSKLVAIDNFVARRRTDDYISIQGPTGNIVYQVQDMTIPNLVNKTIAYITPESISVNVPFVSNPLMSEESRALAATVIREVWDQDALYADGDGLYERLWHLMVRGAYVYGYDWLAPEDADVLQDGWPFRGRLYDIFDAAPLTDANGRVESIIIQRKEFASRLPDPWVKKAGQNVLPSDELEVGYYCDRVQYGVVIGGTIVQPLTPHGYVYPDGVTPMCPYAYVKHAPQVIRNGSVGPAISGFSQLGEKVGIPPVYYLLDGAEISSRVQTAQMEHIRRTALSPVVEQGRVKRPNDTGLDLTETSIEVDDKGKLTYLVPPENLPSKEFLQDVRDNMLSPAGMDNHVMSGTGPTQGVTGTAQSHQTSMPRAFAKVLSITLKKGLEREASIIVGLCVSKLSAGAIAQVKHDTGETMPTVGGDDDPLNQGVSLVFSASAIPVDDLTFYGFRRAEVSVTPDTSLAPETALQAGMQALLAKDPATGETALPLEFIAEHFFSALIKDPAELADSIRMARLRKLPGSPLGVADDVRVMLQRYGSVIGQQKESLEQGLGNYLRTALPAFMQELMNPTPAPAPGEQPPGPGQPPPGGQPPTPGGSDQPPQPPVNVNIHPPNLPQPGVLPPQQAPGGPVSAPQGPMMPGGGNPLAAVPPPPPPNQGLM